MSKADDRKEIEGLFSSYAAGFDDFDEEAVAELFTYPVVIWQQGQGYVFDDDEELLENIEALLEVFENEEIVQSEFTIEDLHISANVALARVAWQQMREGGEDALAFRAHYQLLRDEDGWVIASVVNEDDDE